MFDFIVAQNPDGTLVVPTYTLASALSPELWHLYIPNPPCACLKHLHFLFFKETASSGGKMVVR